MSLLGSDEHEQQEVSARGSILYVLMGRLLLEPWANFVGRMGRGSTEISFLFCRRLSLRLIPDQGKELVWRLPMSCEPISRLRMTSD